MVVFFVNLFERVVVLGLRREGARYWGWGGVCVCVSCLGE